MPAVAYEGVAVPSLRKFPGEPDTGKKGSSDTGECTGLMSRFIRLSGAGRIAELCADRESVGGERFGRLHSRGIRISVRVRGNRCITDSEGTAVRGSVLFREPKSGGSRIPGGRRKTGDVGVHIGGMRLPDGEFPTAAGSGNPGIAPGTYAQRWQTGTMSACPETEGSGFGDTHLTDLRRTDRLPGIVCAASSVRAYPVGEQPDGIQPVHIKKLPVTGQKVSSDTDPVISENPYEPRGASQRICRGDRSLCSLLGILL